MARLIIAIVNNLDAEHVVEVLRNEGHRLTEIPSFGGYFHAENTTLLIAVEDEAAEQAVLEIIGRECSAREVEVPAEVSGARPADLREEQRRNRLPRRSARHHARLTSSAHNFRCQRHRYRQRGPCPASMAERHGTS